MTHDTITALATIRARPDLTEAQTHRVDEIGLYTLSQRQDGLEPFTTETGRAKLAEITDPYGQEE